MGQVIGKCTVIGEARAFVNLSSRSIELIWDAFNDVAEGFGVDCKCFQQVCSVLGRELSISENEAMPQEILDTMCEALFRKFDTDENDLVDALEFLATFALMSAMPLEAKMKFAFNCYDFDETEELTLDEMTLSMKSTLTGLCKLAGVPTPTELELEGISQDAFRQANKDHHSKITFNEFVQYCSSNPEVAAWINFFDDLDEEQVLRMDEGDDMFRDLQPPVYDPLPIDMPRDVYRSARHVAACEDMMAAPVADGGAQEDIRDKAWPRTAALTTPEAERTRWKGAAPDSCLALQFVHGYRSHDVRNNLRYVAGNEIAYHAATLGIVYHADTHSQRFNMDHTDDVSALAVHPDLDIVATGQVGPRPSISLWSAATCQRVMSIRGFHKAAISFLDFSPDGATLLTVGQDDKNSVALYAWEPPRARLLFSAPTDARQVHDARFVRRDAFVTVGAGHIWFWYKAAAAGGGDGRWVKRQGLFGRKFRVQTLTCVAPSADLQHTVTGTTQGKLLVWRDRNCVRSLAAHQGAVLSLYTGPNGSVSGGRDGKVKMWSPGMDFLAEFDIMALGSFRPAVRSVCWARDGSKLLVGTEASEVFEISATDGANMHPSALVEGHYTGCLWGLAVHPSRPEYATAGEDCTVRVWDLQTRKMVKMVELHAVARCLAYSPDGALLAVGFGTLDATTRGAPRRKDGAYVMLRERDLSVLHEARDSLQCITDIKFSPDGGSLAVCGQDQSVYLYNVEDFTSKGRCVGHSSPITHVDFSADAAWLQSCSRGGDLLFHDASTGEQHTRPAELADTAWHTVTLPKSYGTVGMWPQTGPAPRGAVAVEAIPAVCRSHDGRVAMAGDEFGRIRGYAFPALERTASYDVCRGHTAPLGNLRFTRDDKFLVSVGAVDRCVLQWRHERDDTLAEVEAEEEAERQAAEEARKQAAADAGEAGEGDGKEGEGGADGGGSEETKEEVVADVLTLPPDDPLADRAAAEDMEFVFALEDGGEDGGGQLAPQQLWHSVISAPSRAPPEKQVPPVDDLVLDHVFGYCSDTRNSVRYSSTGEIVYHVACVGIVYNASTNRQRFSTAHTEEVTALTMHPSGELVATAQAGKVPTIAVWACGSTETRHTLAGFHVNSVTLLAFSHDGQRLVSVGGDDAHSIAVYDWAQESLVARAQGDPRPLLALSFTPNDAGLVTAGVKHLKFHVVSGRNLRSRRAVFGRGARARELRDQTFHSVGWSKDKAVVGTGSGQLLVFNGRVMERALRGHGAAVSVLTAAPPGCTTKLVSGGADGVVKLWNAAMECTAEFAMAELVAQGMAFGVRSVALSANGGAVLVGTAGSEVYELNAADGANIHAGPLVQGHCREELWGLDTHPSRPEVVTSGDDHTVRVWSLAERRLLKFALLDCSSRAVGYSPDGSMLGVGLGGSPSGLRRLKDGAFVVLTEGDLAPLHEGRDSAQAVRCVRFSGDGGLLGVASHDTAVYLYDVGHEFELQAQFKAHEDSVAALDFSDDGMFMRSCCAGQRLLFSDTSTGNNIPAAAELRDVEWASDTLPFGWGTRGTWPLLDDGTQVLTVHRSRGRRLLVSGDNFGRLRLYNYPCVTPGSQAMRQFRGHSRSLVCARFSHDDSFVVTIGARDRAIFSWRRVGGSADPGSTDLQLLAGEDAGFVCEYAGEEAGGGSQQDFAAVKPWMGAVVPPSQPPEEDGDAPHLKLSLQFVYGYRSADVRNNLRFNAAEEIVYHSGSVGVVYDKVRHEQRFYNGHASDIISLAVDPRRNLVATGESGLRPAVRVWDASTGEEMVTLRRFHRRGIPVVAFSHDSTKIVSVGSDGNHTVCVWSAASANDWPSATLQAHQSSTDRKVFFAHFTGTTGGGFDLVTGGLKHITFWRLSGRQLNSTQGVFGRVAKVQPLLCAATVGGRVVTGGMTGELLSWEGSRLARSVPAHERAVNALHMPMSGQRLVSGGADGTVKLWNTALEELLSFDMMKMLPTPIRPAVRSVCVDEAVTKVLVGTHGSEIYEICVSSGSAALFCEGHFKGELWALSMHPTDPDLCATAGDDQTVRVWDLKRRRMVSKMVVDTQARSLVWSPTGDLLVVGLGSGGDRASKDGAFIVISSGTMDIVHEGRDSERWITDIKFSPDGSSLAVASRDSNIYLYDVANSFALRAVCSGHSYPVLAVDFSSDGSWLQSNCAGFELKYFDCNTGNPHTSPMNLRDVQWGSFTCPMGWPMQGLWPDPMGDNPAASVTSADRSPYEMLVASGDVTGTVRLWHYPALSYGNGCLLGRGHTGSVTNVRFSVDERMIVSTGARDRGIFQWKLELLDEEGEGEEEEEEGGAGQ